MKRADEILDGAAATYRERAAIYGDSYHEFGRVMMTLFPKGLTVETEGEWSRLGILVQDITKTLRYANQFKSGGHVDSAHDKIVYSAMLEELTTHYADAAKEKKAGPAFTVEAPLKPASAPPRPIFKKLINGKAVAFVYDETCPVPERPATIKECDDWSNYEALTGGDD